MLERGYLRGAGRFAEMVMGAWGGFGQKLGHCVGLCDGGFGSRPEAAELFMLGLLLQNKV